MTHVYSRVVYPKISRELLVNPGVGFVAATGLMGNPEDVKDSRGKPVEAYRFTPNSRTWNHPDSALLNFGFRWKDLEPREGEFDFSSIERKLEDARARGCTAVVRVAPYALAEEEDVPGWLRERYPDRPEYPFWRIDPNTTEYPRLWARFVRAFASRFDGHPLISAVDMAIVGAWGEGAGTEHMKEEGLQEVIRAYMEGFIRTPLHAQVHNLQSMAIIRGYRRDVGLRMDCLGDMGGFHPGKWSHMLDFYPQNIANFQMSEAWKHAPVMFEACWHMNDWYLQGWDIDYIIEESLKWHISAYASKGTAVPEPWKEKVADWVRRMGFRFEIHRVSFSDMVRSGGLMFFNMLLSNTGVAPCYHRYPLVLRLEGDGGRQDWTLDVDIRQWLPDEDHAVQASRTVELAPGQYTFKIGFPVTGLEGRTLELAIEGRDEDGFYPMGEILVTAQGETKMRSARDFVEAAQEYGITAYPKGVEELFPAFAEAYQPKPLMSEEFFESVLNRYALGREHRKLLKDALHGIERNPDLLCLSHFFVEELRRISRRLALDEYDALEPRWGMENPRAYSMILLIACLEPSIATRRAMGMPDEAFLDTAYRALDRQMEQLKETGDPRVRDFPWDRSFYTCDIFLIDRFYFKLERLGYPVAVYRADSEKGPETVAFFTQPTLIRRDGQIDGTNGVHDPQAFETSYEVTGEHVTGTPIHPGGVVYPEKRVLDLSQWKLTLEEQSIVLGLHIPGGPGYDVAHLRSCTQAAHAFFEKWFPEQKVLAFANESWLNDPHLPLLCKPGANIPSMQKEMYLYPCHEGEKMMLHELFENGHLPEPGEPATSLQRSVADFVRQGGKMTSTCMFILAEDIPRLGQGPYAPPQEYERVWEEQLHPIAFE